MPFTSFPPGLAVQSNLNLPEPCHTPAANGADFDMNTLLKRYQQTIRCDNEKSNFIAELMLRVEYLTQDNDALKLEKQQNHELVSTFQTQKANYEKYIKNMQRALSENPFIMLLIDGDGMIFNDELVREGEEGGCKAAALLHKAVQEYVETELLDVPVASQIACRIYANVRGLGDVLVRTGVIEELSVFEDFVRGFTRGKALFDFIDVGFGKDRADKKIIELLKLFSQDFHCRRILFGCSHDNGYARALEENVQSEELVKKVVLLEGVPFEKELMALPYRTKKFNGLFRETKIVSTNLRYSHAIPLPLDTPTGAVNFRAYNAYAGMPSRFPPPRATVLDSPLPAAAAIAAAQLPRTPSSSTLASDGIAAAKPALNNWAAKAAAPPPPVTEVSDYKRVTRDDVIARNRSGQRIDPPCKDYDKAEVDRIKKMKLCNVYFLRQECPYDNNCTHIHAFKPTREEISTLRLVARMAPCVYGSGCDDVKCIYGHRCPAPAARTGVKGTKSCIFGESCKFAPELHDIDSSVVKTLVVR